MSYTIRNLREVEDLAIKHGFDRVQEARFARADLEAERTGVALMAVKPGQRQAFAHRHEAAEEIYVILSGEGRVKLGDEVLDVRPLDAIRVAPEVPRAFEAGESKLEYLVFGAHHPGDAVMLEDDFWG